jgi:hypothetical protein
MLTGQFNGAENPHLHHRQFLKMASNFKIFRVIDEAFRYNLKSCVLNTLKQFFKKKTLKTITFVSIFISLNEI